MWRGPSARSLVRMPDAPNQVRPTWLTDDVVESVALGLVAPDEWVHRRVESITFIDDETLLRRASVDFTVGFATPVIGDPAQSTRIVPVTLLRKRDLRAFDIRGADGRSLPILTTRQNGELANAVLQYTVGAVAGSSIEAIVPELGRIATSPLADAQIVRSSLLTRLSSDPSMAALRSLADNEIFSEFTQQFAENFILAALVDEADGRRAVLKFSYEEPAQSSDVSRFERFTQAMGWSAREFRFDIPAAATAQSYHVEIRAPEGVTFNGAASFPRGVDHTTDDSESDFQPIGMSRRGQALVHFHVQGGPTANATVYIWLRIQREGWLRNAVFAMFAVAVLMVLNAWRLPTLLGGRQLGNSPGQAVSTDVAALLMAVVALVLSFAIRLGEHPVTARTAVGVRIATIASAVLPLANGWLLAFGPTGRALQAAWWWAAIASVALLVLVGFAYRGPSAVTPLP